MLHHALLTLGEMYFLDFELTLNIESVEFHYLQEVLAKQNYIIFLRIGAKLFKVHSLHLFAFCIFDCFNLSQSHSIHFAATSRACPIVKFWAYKALPIIAPSTPIAISSRRD